VMEADRADADARADQLKKRREEARSRIAQARMEAGAPQPRDLQEPKSTAPFPHHDETDSPKASSGAEDPE
jgi:hypothetical protein